MEDLIVKQIQSEGGDQKPEDKKPDGTPASTETPDDKKKPENQPEPETTVRVLDDKTETPGEKKTEEQEKKEVEAKEKQIAEEKEKVEAEKKRKEVEDKKAEESEDEIINRLSSGKFKNKEELNNATILEDEIVKGLQEYLKSGGGDIVSYANIQTRDFGKMGDEEVIKFNIAQKNPELSNDEVNILYKNKYPMVEKVDEASAKAELKRLNPDMEDVEINNLYREKYPNADAEPEANVAKKIEIKQDAKKDRIELEELKKELPKKPEDNSEEIAKYKEKWATDLNDGVTKLETLPIVAKDKDGKEILKLDYKINEDSKKALQEFLADPNSIWAKFSDNGKADMDKLLEYFYKAENFDTIVEAITTQANAKGAEGVMTEIQNPSGTPESKPAGSGGKSIEEQVADEIMTG